MATAPSAISKRERGDILVIHGWTPWDLRERQFHSVFVYEKRPRYGSSHLARRQRRQTVASGILDGSRANTAAQRG
ncbi:MAG TPA: hypothetical protein VI072_02335, partial [Polyangiaceae bacterium]